VSLGLQIPFEVREESHVGQVRRRAQQMAADAGLSEQDAARMAIIATEMATNVVKHGSGGEVMLRQLRDGVEAVALDKGRGMSDVSRCLSDGFSSSGTAGNGLGAIRRLSSLFEIYSQPGAGTAVLSRIALGNDAASSKQLDVGVICRPKEGEVLSGDSWAFKTGDSGSWIVVADGLGHGPDANYAASEAVRIFRDTNGHRSTTDLIEAMHGALRKTRGAAVAVAHVDRVANELKFSGVGNIAASILNGPNTWKGATSHNGILGHEVRRIQEFSFPWSSTSKLFMHSDGLATWSLDKYPGLLRRHPALIASVLYRDFWRHRDDVTVFIAQEKQSA
jgi:anti-sigma regulatory factor (Ser/Thr protein kinase)